MIPSEQDLQIRDVARQFAQERLKPFAADWDREHRFPAEALREMGVRALLMPLNREALMRALTQA